MIGCIIQTRMGSTRLPGKVMLKIDKKYPTIHYVLEQESNLMNINQKTSIEKNFLNSLNFLGKVS